MSNPVNMLVPWMQQKCIELIKGGRPAYIYRTSNGVLVISAVKYKLFLAFIVKPKNNHHV